MRIQLSEIADASKCLRYFNFLQDVTLPRPNLELQVAQDVIKKAYLVALESGYRADWRRIIGWVDTAVFADVDFNQPASFEEAKMTSEHILKFISSWYNKIYMPENTIVYTDVPLETKLGRNTIVGVVPVVRLLETPVITIVSDIATSPSQLYNQIEIRGLQWMLSESLEVPSVQVDCLYLGPKGGFLMHTMYASKEDNDRAKDVINQVGSMIAAKFDIPSYTEMCQTCPFKVRCKI